MKLSKLNIFFFIIYLAASLIFFSYIFYKSEILAFGSKYDFYSKYYFASGLMFLFSFLVLILNKDKLIKSSLVVISLIISLYLIESFLTISLKKDSNENIKYIKDFKQNSPDLVPVIYFADHFAEKKINQKLVPLAGIANKKTVFCKEDGPLIKYQSDRFGFNNDDDTWKKNIFAVTIGDSFTHGACVERKDTIAKNIMKEKNILNLGIGGSGPLIQYAILREYLNETKSKNVIWIYYEENDLGDLLFELSNPVLKKYLKKMDYSQKLIYKQKEIDKKLIKVLHSAITKRNNFQIKDVVDFIKLKKFRTLFIDKLERNEVTIPKQFIEIMKQVKEKTIKQNINLYFVYLPEKNRYIRNLKKDQNFRQYKKIKKIINDLDIQLIDLKLEFQNQFTNPLILYSENHPHLNSNGYRTVGKLISDGINK